MNFKSTKFLKRFKFSWVWGLFVVLSMFFFSGATTATPTDAQLVTNPNTAGVVYLGEYIPNLTYTSGCMIWGCPPGQGGNTNSDESQLNQGAIVSLAGLSDSLYQNPSTSGIVWAQDQYNQIRGLEEFTVQAQDPNSNSFYFPGLGYTVLQPVNALWQWARNLTYFAFIVILVVVSFLILFRRNLGGQTLVTITNSIPSIIWALLLVTLSYPITGLFVDFITIGTNFAQSVLITGIGAPGSDFVGGSDIFGFTENDVNYLQPNDPEFSIWSIWYLSNADICEDENCQVNNIIPDIETPNRVLQYVGNIAQEAALAIGDTNVVVRNPLLNLVLGIAAFTASFKLFMSLLKNYVLIIMYAVLSPFIFVTAAIPSRTSSTINNFVRTLGAASLTFILTYALFLLIVIIGRGDQLSGAVGDVANLAWAPPLLGYSQDQILGSDGIVRLLIIYFLFIFSPSINDLVKDFLQVPQTSQYIQQVGQETGTAAKRGAGLVQGVATKIFS